MSSLNGILSNYTYLFIIIFIRYLGIFLISPIFGSKMILSRLKVGITLLLTFITFPVLKQTYSLKIPEKAILIVGDLVQELAIGFLIGFLVFLFFAAVQLAGQFIDLRMGFRIANVFDPLTGASSPVIGQFKNIMVTLIFLTINGHHKLINSIFKSFDVIPLGEVSFNNQLWQFIFRKSGDLFIIAFEIALPVMGTIFIVDVILGFLARSVPQMNIFIVGLPVKILIGFIIIFLSLHIVINYYQHGLDQVFKDIMKLIKLMEP